MKRVFVGLKLFDDFRKAAVLSPGWSPLWTKKCSLGQNIWSGVERELWGAPDLCGGGNFRVIGFKVWRHWVSLRSALRRWRLSTLAYLCWHCHQYVMEVRDRTCGLEGCGAANQFQKRGTTVFASYWGIKLGSLESLFQGPGRDSPPNRWTLAGALKQ